MIIIFLVSLLLIGIIANYSGIIAEKFKLPSLIGMMIMGMIIGPSFFNLIPESTLLLAPTIKDIALVIVLFIGGLGISVSQMKQIGRPAVLLSVIPATLEGFAIAIMSMILLDFTFIQGAILGFIIAAVSPAVLIPSMISLIERKIGQDKAIPQMLLVGASADDTIAITLFTTFLGIYMQSTTGESISIAYQLILIPTTIVLSIIIGYLVFKLSYKIIDKIPNKSLKALVALLICLAMRFIEKNYHIEVFNSLLTIMVFGFYIRNNIEVSGKYILEKMNGIWKIGKLYLFSFVGMAINPTLVGEYFLIGLLLLTCSLFIRSIGVIISLIGTDLSKKEKLFCVIAYLPKATVQSAKAAIPLQMGVLGGEIMQAIAILSVLITAPIGAIGIKLTATKFLSVEDDNKEESKENICIN